MGAKPRNAMRQNAQRMSQNAETRLRIFSKDCLTKIRHEVFQPVSFLCDALPVLSNRNQKHPMKTSAIATRPILETLEPRIAPATLVAGATGKDYNDAEFVPMDDPDADPAVAGFFNNSPDHYYLPVKKGDLLLFDDDGDMGTKAQSWVQVKAGSGFLFFYDKPDGLNPGDGEITKDELTGISIGGAVSLIVNGDVNGSILTNVNGAANNAFLSNTLADHSKNYFTDLQVTGDIEGSVFSAGKIAKGSAGSVPGLYTGNGGAAVAFQLGGGDGVGGGVVEAYDMPVGKAGSGISNFIVQGDADFVMAGDGGASGAGGPVSNVKVLGNIGDLSIEAGDGGFGIVGKMNGGAGGKISGIEVHAAAGTVLDGGRIFVEAGNGGDGLYAPPTKAGNGGVGGSVDKVIVGCLYDGQKKSWLPDADDFLVGQEVTVRAGAGGIGKTGGLGGGLGNASVYTGGSDIFMHGGHGGSAFDMKGLKLGAGGSLNNLFAISDSQEIGPGGMVQLLAGNAGTHDPGATFFGAGANGGSVSNVLGIGATTALIGAPGGSDGVTGGHGGFISKVFANTLFTGIDAFTAVSGGGGAGETGNGGNAGKIDGVVLGGSYDTKAKSWNPNDQTFLPDTVIILSGTGGNGKTGGRGGDLLNNTLFAQEASVLYMAGDGGIVTHDAAGTRGGHGGAINGLYAVVLTEDISAPTGIHVLSGSGGDGQTLGVGGNGGPISNLSGLAALDISVTSGAGGGGATGGNGGLISNVKANTPFSALQSVMITSGAGGDGLLKAGGHGGAITDIHADNAYYQEHFTGRDQAPDRANFLNLSGGTGDVAVNSPSRGINVNAGWFNGFDWVGTLQGNLTINAPTYGDLTFFGSVDENFSVNAQVFGRLVIDEGAYIGGDLNIAGNVDFGIFVRSMDMDTWDFVYTAYNPVDHPGIVGGAVNIAPQIVRTMEAWQDNGFDLAVEAGKGGDGKTAGGNGGSLTKSIFTADSTGYADGPFDELTWNAVAGHGGTGNSDASKGGHGGAVSDIFFYGFSKGGVTEFSARAGDGGEAGAVGGNGGAIGKVAASIHGEEALLRAGNGGAGLADKSRGGLGGSISKTSLLGSNSFGVISQLDATRVDAGTGGDGGLAGGNGGSVQDCVLNASDLALEAGHGGEGGTTHGSGGSIVKNSATSNSQLLVSAGDGSVGGSVQSLKVDTGDSVEITAGNGIGMVDGVTGKLKPAHGGSVRDVEFVMYGFPQYGGVQITAGDGDMGGNGGNIENVRDKVFGRQGQNFLQPSGFGGLQLQAGNGSDGERSGGTGGSIKNVKLVAPDAVAGFFFVAGDGGAGVQGGKGGSVDGVAILSTTTAYQKVWQNNRLTEKAFRIGFDTDNAPALGFVEISTGNGGDSDARMGGGAGDAKNIAWNTPWEIEALTRILNPGAPGMGSDSPGPEAKITNVVPNPLS
jgi:hypothetical protein